MTRLENILLLTVDFTLIFLNNFILSSLPDFVFYGLGGACFRTCVRVEHWTLDAS